MYQLLGSTPLAFGRIPFAQDVILAVNAYDGVVDCFFGRSDRFFPVRRSLFHRANPLKEWESGNFHFRPTARNRKSGNAECVSFSYLLIKQK